MAWSCHAHLAFLRNVTSGWVRDASVAPDRVNHCGDNSYRDKADDHDGLIVIVGGSSAGWAHQDLTVLWAAMMALHDTLIS